MLDFRDVGFQITSLHRHALQLLLQIRLRFEARVEGIRTVRIYPIPSRIRAPLSTATHLFIDVVELQIAHGVIMNWLNVYGH